MAIKTIKEESLTALGDAIRAKTGNEDLCLFRFPWECGGNSGYAGNRASADSLVFR